MTVAEEHDEAVKYTVETWRDLLAENLSVLLAKGRVPGITPPSKAELRGFFETTDELYWLSLVASDPQEALSQLEQWRAVKA